MTKIWTSLTKSYTGRDVTYASVNLVLEDGTSAGLPETHELGDIDVRSQFKTSQTLVDGPTLPIRSGTITLVIAASANAPAVVTTDVLVPGAATN